MRRSRSRSALIGLAAAAMVSTGCFGSFQATRNVWSWNKSIGGGNKWAQELVFLIIGPILPVYGIAGLLDTVILNSIEFWTGTNPMTASLKVTEHDGTKVAESFKTDESGRTQVVEVSNASGVQSTTTCAARPSSRYSPSRASGWRWTIWPASPTAASPR